MNPAYVSSVRLTASGIANRLQFDIDEIEDIKTAVSEACVYIIKQGAAFSTCEICFILGQQEVKIEITAPESLSSNGSNVSEDMSIRMIQALVDEFSIERSEEKQILITMLKRHNVG